MQRTFVYDAENRQISNNINGTATLYSYDGAGQRVTKYVSPNPTSVYVYDAMGLLVAEYAGPTNPDTGTRYLTADHLGSTRLVTKVDGTIDRTYDYLPFGEEIGASYPSAPSGPSQKFTGQERDAESGMDFFKARYMSAPQGRFMSPDPVGMFVADPTNPQSWNHYGYVFNNPLAFIDPTGMRCDMADWFTNCGNGGWADQTFGNPNPGGSYGTGVGMFNFSYFDDTPEQNTFHSYNLLFYYDPQGGGGGGGGGGSSCSNGLVSTINSFLASHLPQGDSFLNTGSTMNSFGSKLNVDPRLASSILALESGNGRAYKGNNPFGIAGGHKPFDSPASAIQYEFNTLGNHINLQGQASVAALYSGASWVWKDPSKPHWPNNVIGYPGYCGSDSGPVKCGAGGDTVSKFLIKQGGNPTSLNYPCKD